MKRFFIILTILICFCVMIFFNNALAQNYVIQGGIQKNVPVTANEVSYYLIQMKTIMAEFDSLSQQATMTLMTQKKPSVQTSQKFINEWIRLANKIDNIVPPVELKSSHKKLATSLRQSCKFLANKHNLAQNQQEVLFNLMPIATNLGNATMNYQNDVNIVINKMGLSSSLNPLGQGKNINQVQSQNVLSALGAFNSMGSKKNIPLSGSGNQSMLQGIDLKMLQQAIQSLDQVNKQLR